MKKVILSAAMGLAMFSASADEVVVDNAVADAAVENIFDGIYFGLGLGGSFLKNNQDYLDTATATPAYDSRGKNSNRLIGVAALGFGKTFNSFYVGTEASADFSKSNSRYFGDISRISCKNVGITPALSARLGYAPVNGKTMFYGKVSVVRQKVTVRRGDVEIGKVNKFTPAIALGVERAFCKKFSARVEAEYLFSMKKDIAIDPTKSVKIKSGNGLNLRALVAYNVKI